MATIFGPGPSMATIFGPGPNVAVTFGPGRNVPNYICIHFFIKATENMITQLIGQAHLV